MSNSNVLFVEPGARKRILADLAFDDPEISQYRPPTLCAYPDCSDSSTYLDTPLCRAHAAVVWRLFELHEPATHHDLIREQYKASQQERVEESERIRLDSKRPGFIYYVQIADRIKIGFTSSIEDRMKAYPPHSVLLASHPGTLELERTMHSQFRLLLADGREWFRPGEKLLEHIEDVKKRFPKEDAPYERPKLDWGKAPKHVPTNKKSRQRLPHTGEGY